MFIFLKLWHIFKEDSHLSSLKSVLSGGRRVCCPVQSLSRWQAYQEQSPLILFCWAVWHVLGGVNTVGSLMPS